MKIENKSFLELAKCDRTDSTTLESIYNELTQDRKYYEVDIEPVLKQIALNPNTPAEVLIKLGICFLKEIRSNPALELIRIEHPDFGEQILKHYANYLCDDEKGKPYFRDRDLLEELEFRSIRYPELYPHWITSALRKLL